VERYIESLRNVDLNLLLALAALLEEGSVTKAASRLSVSQSTMSHALGRLRSHFNDPLLVRAASGMVRSTLGEQLRPSLSHTLSEIDRLMVPHLAFEPARDTRSLVVMMSDHGALVIFPELARLATQAAPNLRLALVNVDERPCEELLESGGIDLGVGFFAGAPTRIMQQKLLDDDYVVVNRQGHPALRDGRLDLESYERCGHVDVLPRGSQPVRTPLYQALATCQITRRVHATVPSFTAALRTAAFTDLLATVPRLAARIFAESMRLRTQPTPFPTEPISIRQFWHERRAKDPAHVWLRQVVVQVATGLMGAAVDPR
jgi:DNA-binding transcriptional LysR family regulator